MRIATPSSCGTCTRCLLSVSRRTQSNFHWHLEQQDIRHVYIRPRTPRLNGKVERSHRVDEQEFYQLLDKNGIGDDIHLFNDKLREGRTITITTGHVERSMGRPPTSGSWQGKPQPACHRSPETLQYELSGS